MQPLWCEGTGADLIQAYDPAKRYLVHVFCIEQNMLLKGLTVRFVKQSQVIFVQTRVGFVVMISADTPFVKWREKRQKSPRR